MALEIPIDEQHKLFKNHLTASGNERIIFSGAFGVGKTYFLEKFFAPSEMDYLAIKLSPVNYSISSNEDIFEIIKYDILFELATIHRLALESEAVNWDVALGVALPPKAEKLIQSFLPFLPLLNKESDAIPIVLAALAAWMSIGKEISKERNDTAKEAEIIAFGDRIAAKFQLETDYITKFLESGLAELAEAKGARYKILIIDDLDRIDPEHTFRLFNIFSAHLDYNRTAKNKFGFDKVVFVCDIQNVRNIFHSRYGADTDFNGYIDKFFSREVYHYNNDKEVGKYVDHIIDSFDFERTPEEYYQQQILQGRTYREKGLLQIILRELMLSGALKMRRLSESYGMHIPLPSKQLEFSAPSRGIERVHYRQLPALVTIEILATLMGGGQPLLRGIKTVMRYQKSLDYKSAESSAGKWMIGILLPLLDFTSHQFLASEIYETSKKYYNYVFKEGGHIGYSLLVGRDNEQYSGELINGDTIEFFRLLDLAVDDLLRNGVLK